MSNKRKVKTKVTEENAQTQEPHPPGFKPSGEGPDPGQPRVPTTFAPYPLNWNFGKMTDNNGNPWLLILVSTPVADIALPFPLDAAENFIAGAIDAVNNIRMAPKGLIIPGVDVGSLGDLRGGHLPGQ